MYENSIVSTTTSQYHEVPIRDSFNDTESWAEEIAIIRNCGPNDTVHLLINGDGGTTATLIEFLTEIGKCKGHVITELTGTAYSAFGMLLLAGDEIRTNPHTSFHAHTVQYSVSGNEQNIRERVEFTQLESDAFCLAIYEHFYTEEELERLRRGAEMYLNSDEVDRRVKLRAAIWKQEAEDEKAATELDRASWSKERLLSYIGDNYNEDDWLPKQLDLAIDKA